MSQNQSMIVVIYDIGGTLYSIAYWNGCEWQDIYYDNVVYARPETENFYVSMWADRCIDQTDE